MLKKISKIGGASEMKTSAQKSVTGGILLRRVSCESTCVTASSGTACGPPHCPGVCTGNGGWINY